MNIQPKQGFCYHIKSEYFDKAKIDNPENAAELMDCTSDKQSRPALFVMNDLKNPNIMWMCPGSTKVENKYKPMLEGDFENGVLVKQGKEQRARSNEVMTLKIHPYDVQWDDTIKKYEPKQTAWLLQNLFPVTKEYLSAVHIGTQTGKPLQIDRTFLVEVQNATKAILEEERKPINIANRENLFSDKRWEKLFVNTISLEKMLVQEQRDMKLSQEYQAVANKHPDKAILVETDKYTYALGDTAIKLAKAYEIEPKTIATGIDVNDRTPIVRIAPGEDYMKSAAAILLKQGEKVACKKISGEVVNYIIPKPQKEQQKEQRTENKPQQPARQPDIQAPAQGTMAKKINDAMARAAQIKDPEQKPEKPPPSKKPKKGDDSR